MSIDYIIQPISINRVKELALESFGDFAKAVVDIERGAMTVGGEMHVDGESLLLQHGSRQDDVWGINLYPDNPSESWIEFDSMVNIRPRLGNRSRDVESEATRDKIKKVVNAIVFR